MSDINVQRVSAKPEDARISKLYAEGIKGTNSSNSYDYYDFNVDRSPPLTKSRAFPLDSLYLERNSSSLAPVKATSISLEYIYVNRR